MDRQQVVNNKPPKLATADDLEAVMADLPAFTDAEPVVAGFAFDLSLADMDELRQFDGKDANSPALEAVAAAIRKRGRPRTKSTKPSAVQERDEYALRKKVETGEDVRAYEPTDIAPRDLRPGHFETEAEYKRRYQREWAAAKRPKFVPLTDEEKKVRKRLSNAKRTPSRKGDAPIK